MSLAEVHTLYESNCRSIAEMLRKAADSIDSEPDEDCSPTVAIAVVRLVKNGEIDVYGWGDCDDHKAIALLARGQAQVTSLLNWSDE